MNTVACKILDILFKNKNQNVRIDALSTQLHVSDKTIMNYLKQIESFLEAIQLHDCIFFSKSLIKFVGDDILIRKISDEIYKLDIYSYKLSSEERRKLVSLLLLLSKNGLTLEYLSDTFFVSKPTISKDIKWLKDNKGLVFSYINEKKNGVQFIGDEFEARMAIWDILQQTMNSVDYYWNKKQYLDKIQIIKQIEQMIPLQKYMEYSYTEIKKSEERMTLELNDKIFYELGLFLSMIFYRIDKKYYIAKKDTNVMKEMNETCFTFSKMLLKSSNIFDNQLLESEVLFLTSFIQKNRYLVNDGEQNYISIALSVKKFLLSISKFYHNIIEQDEVLPYLITDHLTTNYLKNIVLDSEIKQSILQAYAEDYKNICQHINILEEGLARKIDDDTILFIVMHVVSSYERIRQAMPKLKVVIACNSGIGSANLLATMISKYFDLEIVSITSIHKLEEVLAKKSNDLVISTVPLRENDYPWVECSLLLTTEEIQNIEMSIENIYKEKYGFSTPVEKIKEITINKQWSKAMMFGNILSEDLIALSDENKNWMEAIESVGNLLAEKGFVSKNYVNEMNNIVKELGPYIVFSSGVAIAHARPSDGVFQTSCSFIRYSKPVIFGDRKEDRVHFVIALAIEDDSSLNKELLHSVFYVMNNEETKEKLMKATTKKEIIEIINYCGK